MKVSHSFILFFFFSNFFFVLKHILVYFFDWWLEISRNWSAKINFGMVKSFPRRKWSCFDNVVSTLYHYEKICFTLYFHIVKLIECIIEPFSLLHETCTYFNWIYLDLDQFDWRDMTCLQLMNWLDLIEPNRIIDLIGLNCNLFACVGLEIYFYKAKKMHPDWVIFFF